MTLLPLHSIRSKLVAGATLLIAVICILGYSAYVSWLNDHHQKALAENSRNIAEILATQVVDPLLRHDRAVIERDLESVEGKSHLLYAVVVDDSGEIVATLAGDPALMAQFVRGRPYRPPAPSATVYGVTTPILRGTESIGSVHAGFSLEEIQQELASSKLSAALLCLAIFAASLLLVVSLSLFLTRPLGRMVATVDRIAQGDLSHRALVTTDDELGQLARSFNLMVTNLEAAYRELRTANQDLEQRAKELQKQIGERRRAEGTLTALNQFSGEVISNAGEGIIVYDKEFRYRLWNPVMEKLTGMAEEDVVNKSAFELFPYLREHGVDKLLEEALRGQRVKSNDIYYEIKQTRKSGWFVGTYGPLRNSKDEIIGVIEVVSDTTERRRAEEQIRDQAALLNVTRDAIIVRDLNDRITFWNKGAELIYGWTRDEALGRTTGELIYADDEPQPEEPYRAVMRTGGWSGELKQRTKDDKRISVESRWTPVHGKGAKADAMLIVNTDITDKKRLESQFLRAQRLENLGTLAGGIAHDLNNVLAPILIAIQVLQKKIKDQKAGQMLSTLESSARRGADIVKQVLTFARGAEGQRALLQVKHLLVEIEKMAGQTFPRAIQIRSDIPQNLWTVAGDGTQLHQVLMNLCVNARDAMPSGGTIFLRAENILVDEKFARIHLDAKPGHHIRLEVSDTGSGIPPEVIDRIFDPFFTTKEVGKGTGLGLSTVAAIVKGHGGFLTVESEIGKGTAFAIYLPATSDGSAAVTKDTDDDLPIGHNETVLVVDDESAIREITKETLEVYGYKVLTAQDGVEALSIYETNKRDIDLVLTDMMMPYMDGGVLIRTLHRIDPKLKIIAVSGLMDGESATDMAKTKVNGFIQKPFKADKLLIMLRNTLDGKRQSMN